MLVYDPIDVSEGIDTYKTNSSLEFISFHASTFSR